MKIMSFIISSGNKSNSAFFSFLKEFETSLKIDLIIHCREMREHLSSKYSNKYKSYTVEPLLRGHHDERPTPLEGSLNKVNVIVLNSTHDERPPFF